MAFARRTPFRWKLRSRSVDLGERTLVMGVLNVTPDSFSDGGEFLSPEKAVAHALRMLDEGADLVDVGGESTRPGTYQTVSAQQEQDRVLPAIEGILRERPECVLSIDTYKAETARAALNAGAEIVNDVSGFGWDRALPAVCAELGCGVVLMHTRGRPDDWGTQPRLAPEEVMSVVKAGLAQSLEAARAAGIDHSSVVLDPGFGFGKAYDNNYPLLAHLDELLILGRPLLAGVSRKSFLGRTLAGGAGEVSVDARQNATLAATTSAILGGASIVRVHEVRPAVEAARIADAILKAL